MAGMAGGTTFLSTCFPSNQRKISCPHSQVMVRGPKLHVGSEVIPGLCETQPPKASRGSKPCIHPRFWDRS